MQPKMMQQPGRGRPGCTEVYSGTFVTNGGARTEGLAPFWVNSNTFVFGALDPSGDYFKMVSVDATGTKIESRYMRPGPTTLSTLTLANWDGATKGGFGSYSATDIVKGPCRGRPGMMRPGMAQPAYGQPVVVGGRPGMMQPVSLLALCECLVFKL